MKNRIWALALLILAPPPSALAVKEYYSFSRSVRSYGMGGAYYGNSADEYALFYNPASLSLYEGGKDLMFSLQAETATSSLAALSTLTSASGQTAATLANDLQQYSGQPLYIGATPFFPYYIRKHFAVGLLLADVKGDLAIVGRDLDTSVDLTALIDTGLFVSYARPILPRLHAGATLKGVYRAGGRRIYSALDLAQGTSVTADPASLGGGGGGIDFDLGLTYELEGLPFGDRNTLSLVMNNGLASSLPMARRGAGTPPGLPRLVTLAASSRLPGIWKFERFDMLFDLAEFQIGGSTLDDLGSRSGSIWRHINFGVEAPLRGSWFFARAGFHQGNFCAGIGIDARFFKMDLATYAEELSYLPGRLTSRRIALRIAFGFGGSTKPVEVATEVTVPSRGASEKKDITATEATVPTATPTPDAPDPSTELGTLPNQ